MDNREDAVLLMSVAPHVGAWIETSMTEANIYDNPVAPHVGAWIETHYIFFIHTGI